MRSSLLALFVVVLAAGCGSDPASLQGSDEALKDASTSRVEWRLEGKALPDWAMFRSLGSIDYAEGRGELAFDGASDSASEARIIFVGREAYLGASFDGKMHWLKQTAEGKRAADRFLPGAIGMTPDRLLKDLIDKSKKVEKLGTEDIRGVATTHYRAHLDESTFEINGNSDVPDAVDAWIDEDGLPRRVRVPYGVADDSIAAVVDLFDFGVKVDAEAPPADEIVPEEKFNRLMEKECADAGKDFEHANPLCPMFAVALESGGSSSIEPVPTATVPPEGK